MERSTNDSSYLAVNFSRSRRSSASNSTWSVSGLKSTGQINSPLGTWVAPSRPQGLSSLCGLIPAQLPEQGGRQLPLSHLETEVMHNTNLSTCIVNKKLAWVSGRGTVLCTFPNKAAAYSSPQTMPMALSQTTHCPDMHHKWAQDRKPIHRHSNPATLPQWQPPIYCTIGYVRRPWLIHAGLAIQAKRLSPFNFQFRCLRFRQVALEFLQLPLPGLLPLVH